jgi:uncharacterized protein YbaP (TraB family)
MKKGFLSTKKAKRALITKAVAALVLFCSSNVFATNDESSFESVWAWEVLGTQRKVYLLGELHDFGSETLSISHKLGSDICKTSSEVWTESQQKNLDPIGNKIKLALLLNADTFNQVRRDVEKVISQTSNRSVKGKDELLDQVVSDFETSDPIAAYATFGTISSFKVFKQYPRYKSYEGFIRTARRYIGTNATNIFSIESETAVADTWWKNCSTTSQVEKIVQLGLKKLNADATHAYAYTNEIQKIFAGKNSELKDIDNFLLKQEEEALLSQCSIAPRNKSWLPKILESLSSPGAPITFVVGIGHLGGKEGLIAMLKEAGYTNIKRIYVAE